MRLRPRNFKICGSERVIQPPHADLIAFSIISLGSSLSIFAVESMSSSKYVQIVVTTFQLLTQAPGMCYANPVKFGDFGTPQRGGEPWVNLQLLVCTFSRFV